MIASPDNSASSDESVHVSGKPGTTVLVERFRTLQGLRLLVAEDHPVNRLIVKEILEAVGIKVFLAANGKEAVEKVQALDGKLDVVLMDIQMPVMDGFQASREIRENHPSDALPIVAMTAQPKLRENDNFDEAGMNGYIAKPVSVEKLYELIAVLCGRTSSQIEFSEKSDSSEVYDCLSAQQIPGVRFEKACLRVNGNVRLLFRLIRMFVQEHESATGELGRLIAAGELLTAAHMLHGIKGVAGNLSADRLYQASQELEKNLRSGELSDITCQLAAFGEAFEELRHGAETLPEVFGRERTPSEVSSLPSDFNLLMVELKHLLEINSLAAGDLVEKLVLHVGHTEPILMDLIDLVHKLDYRQALVLLQKVAERNCLQTGELTT